METNWSALLKAVHGSAALTAWQVSCPDVVCTSGIRQSRRHCFYIECSTKEVSASSGAQFDYVRQPGGSPTVTAGAWLRDLWISELAKVDDSTEFRAYQTKCSSSKTPVTVSTEVSRDGSISVESPDKRQDEPSNADTASDSADRKPVSTSESSVQTLETDAALAACRQRLLGFVKGFDRPRWAKKGAADSDGPLPGLQCPICGKMFSSSTVRRRHQLVHSGLRPWSCGHCAANFSLKYNCARHCRDKHPHLPILVLLTRTRGY